MIGAEALIRAMHLPAERTLEFFIMFARTEYALIAAGFRRERHGGVEADWDGLAACLEQRPPDEVQPLVDAGRKLSQAPPKKLTVVDGRAAFREVSRAGQSDVRWVVDAVRRARNNLFHGGKFLTTPDPVTRNEFVVTEALAVLRALLELPALGRVLQAYDEV